MSSLRSVVPPRTRQFIKDAIGLPQINERLGTIEERLGGVDQSIAVISADCTVKNALSEMRERLEESERRLARLLAAGEDPRKQFQIPYWYDTSFVEPCVALALRDLCRPGDVVFDVGANCGALSLLMSRLVGPRGVVCSFEASRRIVDKCQYNLAVNGCHNSQLFHRAVFSHSGEILKIYHGSHLNDTVVAEYANTANFDTVETVSLDDFVNHFDLHPKFIKMDIEGAEYDALLGARQTIDNDRPMVALEQQPSDTRCLDMLKGFDYAGIDLATYQEVASAADFPPGVDLANVLFIPRSTLAHTPYRLPISRRQVHVIEKADLEASPDGSVHLRRPVELDRGRYLVRTRFTAQGTDNEAMAGVDADGATIFRYHTNTRFLSTAYRDWVIDLPRRQSIDIFLRFLSGTTDPTLDFSGADIYQFASLSG